MKSRKGIIILVVCALTMVGFLFGNAVNAAISGPGSTGDPLVTKSYVDTEVAKLQKQVTDLKNEVAQLKK